MLNIPHLQAACAAAQAARKLDAPYQVTFPLDPSTPGHQQLIDEASEWARSEDRAGKSRRTVHAGRGEVVFDFETSVDAVHCKLRFC